MNNGQHCQNSKNVNKSVKIKIYEGFFKTAFTDKADSGSNF